MVVTLKTSALNILINMTLWEYKTYNCNFQMSSDLLLTSSKTSFLTSLNWWEVTGRCKQQHSLGGVVCFKDQVHKSHNN